VRTVDPTIDSSQQGACCAVVAHDHNALLYNIQVKWVSVPQEVEVPCCTPLAFLFTACSWMHTAACNACSALIKSPFLCPLHRPHAHAFSTVRK
jgi:hypothetical protein